ncbi:hypothetical protein PJL18_03751 [Paenarthrobacter nicotinovorans]|nr:hypothetical protein [Paenarthrobacter nicotinovorans]
MILGSRPEARYSNTPAPGVPASRNLPPRPSVSWPITSKKFKPMPRTRTGSVSGTTCQSTSAGGAGGKYSRPNSSAARLNDFCSGFSLDSMCPRASTTESTVSVPPSASSTSNIPSTGRAATASVSWKVTSTPSGFRSSNPARVWRRYRPYSARLGKSWDSSVASSAFSASFSPAPSRRRASRHWSKEPPANGAANPESSGMRVG